MGCVKCLDREVKNGIEPSSIYFSRHGGLLTRDKYYTAEGGKLHSSAAESEADDICRETRSRQVTREEKRNMRADRGVFSLPKQKKIRFSISKRLK